MGIKEMLAQKEQLRQQEVLAKNEREQKREQIRKYSRLCAAFSQSLVDEGNVDESGTLILNHNGRDFHVQLLATEYKVNDHTVELDHRPEINQKNLLDIIGAEAENGLD